LPKHFQFWGCGYTPNTLVSSTGLDTTDCGCNFSTLTLLEALGGSGGNTICDAQEKLYQQAIAALLNACDLNGNYPLTTAQVIAEVNAALASCDRATILGEASRLQNFNSNLVCPLK
jgi:hypothetical protein